MTNWVPEDFKALKFEDDIIALFENETIASQFFAQHPEVLTDMDAVAYTSEAPTPLAYYKDIIEPILIKDYES